MSKKTIFMAICHAEHALPRQATMWGTSEPMG